MNLHFVCKWKFEMTPEATTIREEIEVRNNQNPIKNAFCK